MRKGLIFLTVFGLGLAILWLTTRFGIEDEKPDRPGPPVTETGPAEPVQGRVPVRLRGHGMREIFTRGQGKQGVAFRIEGDFEPLNEAYTEYLAKGLEIRSFDPLTGGLQDVIESAHGRFGVEFGEGVLDMRIADEGRVQLTEVTLTRREGHPLAPLTITAPELEVLLDRDRCRSLGDGLVHLLGAGVEGTGLGLVLEGTTGLMALERGGEVTFDRGNRGSARFAAGGALEIEREGPVEQGGVVVRAREGAHLLLTGPSAGRIDAHTLRFHGTLVDGILTLERGTAEGAVVLVRGNEVYRGESASFTVDEHGRIDHALLEEHPSAHLVLEDQLGGEMVLEAQGVGPLTVDQGEGGARFELQGPCRATLPARDLTIEAEGLMQGSSNPALSQVTLVARKKVRVAQAQSRLETEALDARLIADRERSVELFCVGPTRVSGREQSGGVLTVDVDEEIEVQIVGGLWTIPQARGVQAHSVGEDPFRATAGLLRNFDLARRVFDAEGGVTWVGVFGEGRALRAHADEEGRVQLFGDPDRPANFRVLPGRAALEEDDPARRFQAADLTAPRIDLSPTQVDARGGVEARLEATDRSYELSAGQVRLTTPQPASGEPRRFLLESHAVDRLTIRDPAGRTQLRCGELRVRGVLRQGAQAGGLETSEVLATGQVHVEHRGQTQLQGEGQRFALDGQDEARLEGTQDAPVRLWGRLPASDLPFEMTAEHFRWKGELLEAHRPRIVVRSALLPVATGEGAGRGLTQIEAGDLLADGSGLLFSGGVLVQGTDDQEVPILLRSGTLHLGSEFDEELGELSWHGSIRSFDAAGGVTIVYGGLGVGSCSRLRATRSRVILNGEPGNPAVLDMGGVSIESTLLDADLVDFLVTADRGVLRASEEMGAWALEFAGLRPVVADDGTMFVLAAPRYIDGRREARADSGAVWIQEEEWRRRGNQALWGEPADLDRPPPPPPPMPVLPEKDLVENVFRRLLAGDLGRFLRAAYIEGNVESVEDGRTQARAQAVYLDMEHSSGWLKEVEMSAKMEFGSGRDSRVRVSAKEIRTAADGSLRANKATLTTSTQDDPGYVIETGRLVLAPRAVGGWRFSAKPNRLKFRHGLRLPLPPLGSIALDRDGDFVGFVDEEENVQNVDYLKVGSTAKFGTTLGTAFRSDIGRFGRWLARLVGFDKRKIRGKRFTEASYLSDRGVLLGLGFELREAKDEGAPQEDFWFRVYSHGISDKGEDRGLLRVDQNDRSSFRSWIHARGRYPISDTQWIDLAATTQSDPGIQAEFYEPEFQTYEERDTYLHWRRARGSDYYDITVKARVDDYRTDVEELPSVGAYTGETRIGSIAGASLLYGASLDVDVLRRRGGDLRFEDPFFDSFGFPDALGDREVLRANTSHQLSLPARVGFAGLRATPWLKADLTAWDDAFDGPDDPARAALLGGFDLTTTLHRYSADGYVHTLTPTLGYRSDLAIGEHGDTPVRFDELEDPLEGEEISAGLRAIWARPASKNHLDVELRAVRRRDPATGFEDQDLIALLGDMRTLIGDIPFAAIVDARYDVHEHTTPYSRATLAIRPTEAFIMEATHMRGEDRDHRGLFEAAALAARFRMDPKWEFELAQTVDLLRSGNLVNRAVLRRFGADFLFEVLVEDVAGEGGTNFKLNFTPLFLWHPTPLGILER